MSLKAFHIFFVFISTVLALGLSVYSFMRLSDGAGWLFGLYGALCLIGAVALVVYGRYFLKKLRHISYL